MRGRGEGVNLSSAFSNWKDGYVIYYEKHITPLYMRICARENLRV
jgi:hypothetical protein